MHVRVVLSLAAGVLLVGTGAPAGAQDAARDAASAVTAFVGGEIRTAVGATIDGGIVIVRDGLIEAVGADVAVPDGARRIDCTGKIVTPGLIDADSVLPVDSLDARGGVLGADVRAVDAVDPWDARLRTARREGVTALQVPANREQLLGGVAAVVTTAGHPIEPDGALVLNLATPSRSGGLWGAARIAGLRKALVGARNRRVAVDRWKKDLAAYEEKRLALGPTKEERLLLPPELVDAMRLWTPATLAAWRAAAYKSMKREKEYTKPKKPATAPRTPRRVPGNDVIDGVLGRTDIAAGRRVFVRTEVAPDVAALLGIAEEFRLTPVLAGGAGLLAHAQDIAKAGVPVVLTGMASTSAPPGSLPARRPRGLGAALVRAGLRPAIASGGARASRFLRLLVAREIGEGLPDADALRSVTLWAAVAAGVADRTGSIEPGKRADLVVWSGDPFAAVTRAEIVMIGGRVEGGDDGE